MAGQLFRKGRNVIFKEQSVNSEIGSVFFLKMLVGFLCSGELRNEALQIWRGVVCFSRDFTFHINILSSMSTPHKHSFFIITNVLSIT